MAIKAILINCSKFSIYCIYLAFVRLSHSLFLFSPWSSPKSPLIRLTVCVGLLPFNHLLRPPNHIHPYTHMYLDLYTQSPPTSPAHPPAHTTRTTHRRNTLRHTAWTGSTHPQTHNCHFFLSSLFQPLPFIITQPEARQRSVWPPFSTSYPRCTAIYHSARRYQLPSSPLLPRLQRPHQSRPIRENFHMG